MQDLKKIQIQRNPQNNFANSLVEAKQGISA